MSCRAAQAAQAAKSDFDATDGDRHSDRGERKGQAERFLREEVSVGMERPPLHSPSWAGVTDARGRPAQGLDSRWS
jgi:hypothetical protein